MDKQEKKMNDPLFFCNVSKKIKSEFFNWKGLDCIHQIMHQFPISFEFNSHFLLTLADEVRTQKKNDN